MKKPLLLLMCLLVLSQVKADKKRDPINIPVKISYNLPCIVLDVKLTLEKKVSQRGIYYKYAEKYLGISKNDLILVDKEEWSLQRTEINSHTQIDPSSFYSVLMNGNYDGLRINLSPEGYLVGFNNNNQIDIEKLNFVIKNDEVVDSGIISSSRFGLDRPFKVIEDTTLLIEELNKEAQQRSKVKGKRILKTEEEKAADAAHIIFKLRKRRFKILTCNYENLPKDGQSYKQIIESLNKLEKKYLELFLGRIYTEKVYKEFSIIPKSTQKSILVARYSITRGFTSNSDLSGIPVLFEFKNIVFDKNSDTSLSTQSIEGKYLYYRMPARVDVLVLDGKEEIASKNMIIPQLGAIGILSVDVLTEEKLCVDFYSTLGAIKRIYKK